MDVSLDDLIRKKYVKFEPRKGMKFISRSNGSNIQQNQRGKFNPNRKGGGVQQRRSGGALVQSGPPVVGDARNKIILKKRQQLSDARDKLCELAKRSDARLKLEKLRESRMKRRVPVGFSGMSGSLNRKPQPSGIHGVRRQTSFHNNQQALTSVTLQRTINQIPSANRFRPKVPALMDVDVDMDAPEKSLTLCRTVSNDRMRVEPLIHPAKLSVPSPYTWKAPQRITRGEYVDLDYPSDERKRFKLSTPPSTRPIILSDDEDMGEPVRTARSSRTLGSTLASSRMSADVKSRLDSSSRNPQSSHSSVSAQSSGYKIIVSNLQSSVTHEDIRELFEDIGPLLASRLVRPGTAEVVYRVCKDAERAVENYHNRQLDGQPMKCVLIKSRQSSSASSGSVRPPTGSPAKTAGSGKSSVVPDISTIHKALFNKS